MLNTVKTSILAGAKRKASAATGWLFPALLLITTIAVFVPLLPILPWEGLDPSWAFGLNQAVAQGLAFGRDIVFTFGPYSSIYTTSFHPATDHLMVWGALYLSLSFYYAALLNFKESKWHLKGLLLIALSSVIYLRDALFFYYMLLVGVYIFNTTLSKTRRVNNAVTWHVSLIVLTVPFGLFPLIKGSLIACVAVLGLSALLLSHKGDWKSVAIICASPLTSLILFWLLAAQPLGALPLYFFSMLPIIGGYTEAMAVDGNINEISLYVLASVVLLWAVFAEVRASLVYKTIISSFFLIVLFLAFKAGFVRHDTHAIAPGTMILLAGLSASGITSGNRARLSLILATFTWLYIDSGYIKTSPTSAFLNAKSTYSNVVRGLKLRIVERGRLDRDFAERVRILNVRGGLPLFKGTTDIYSYDQSYLIASGNKWNPRPTFQSYAALAPVLAEKNKEHLLGRNAADNIFFKVQPIDGRIPTLEDGASWPALFENYQPTEVINGYLLLKRRQGVSNEQLHDKHLSSQISQFDRRIDVPSSNELVFVKINVRQTLLGRVVNSLFKPSELEIKVTMKDGGDRTYRLISGMAETGFLISPLVESTEDFGLLYGGTIYLEDKKVKSISIGAKNGRALWGKEFEIEFLSLDYPKVPEVLGLYNVSPPIDAKQFEKIFSAKKCDGNVDIVNGVTLPSSIKTRYLLSANGWLAKSAEKGDLPESVYLVLTKRGGERVFIRTKQSPRPDVAAYFKVSQLDSSGYTTIADVSGLMGDYTLGLAYLENGSLNVCPQFNMPTLIGAGAKE